MLNLISEAKCKSLKSKAMNKTVALNLGVREATTEWLAFTDDDALPNQDWHFLLLMT